MATLLEALAFFEFVAAWLLMSLQYRFLPALLFLPGGRFIQGSPLQFWSFLFVATVLYLGLTALPHREGFPFHLDAGIPVEAATLVRRQARALLLWLKVILMAMFLTCAMAAPSWIVPHNLSRTMRVLPFCFLLVLIAFPVRLLRTRRSVA